MMNFADIHIFVFWLLDMLGTKSLKDSACKSILSDDQMNFNRALLFRTVRKYLAFIYNGGISIN